MEKEMLAFKDSNSAVIKIRRQLPDFLPSVKLKYVKLGFGYTSKSAALLIFALMVSSSVFITVKFTGLNMDRISESWTNRRNQLENIDTATCVIGALVTISICFLSVFYLGNRSKPVYLVDFACSKPGNECKVSVEESLKIARAFGGFKDELVRFQRKVVTRAGLGDETYCSRGMRAEPPNLCMKEAQLETEIVIFGSLDSLFEKTGVNPKDIGILVVNCSLFNPTPSLSDMIVNRYKLRTDIKSYHLSGMGCSAGLISIDLARNLLQTNSNTNAIVVSTENITSNCYIGNDRSMLVSNCIFRMGGAAILLSNKPTDRFRSKYELVHLVRTNKAADEKNYNCIFQREDENGFLGVSLSRELMAVAGEALKTNITTLGPLVLPLFEQVMFFSTLIRKKIFKAKVKPYIPNFKLAFEHFCIHAGGRAVLDEMQKSLELTEWHMEPSRMTLYRFGNTSSSSLWYELAYIEAKGRVSKGDRVWQIAFGSGFKCNSTVWKALRSTPMGESRGNPWMDEIGKYPVKVPQS